MKQLFFLSLAVALSIASCTKDEFVDSENKQYPLHVIKVTADLNQSKTTITNDGGNYSFAWSEGDQVKLLQITEDGQQMDESYASVAEAGKTAEFSVSFPVKSSDSFSYLAVYPHTSSEVFRDYNGELKFRIKNPTRQTICPDSFDASSDLLISNVVETTTQPSKLTFSFARVGAILKLRLTGLDPDTPIRSVIFTADRPIAGNVIFNPLEHTYVLDKYITESRDANGDPLPSPYIRMDAPGSPNPDIYPTDGKLDIWMRTYPAELREFTVDVQQQSMGRTPGPLVEKFRRVNIAAHNGASPVTLLDSKMTALTVDMSKNTPVESIAIADKSVVQSTNISAGGTYQMKYVLTPLEASSKVTWSSSNTQVAEIDAYGLITARSAGQVTISCQAGGQSDSVLVNVVEIIPDAVDLALPSGNLWASCNLGSNTPTGYGLYYYWGDPVASKTFDRMSYKYWNHSHYLAGMMEKYNFDGAYSPDGIPDCTKYLDPEDDPATSHLGSGWRSPSNVDFQELVDNCNIQRVRVNDVEVLRFISKNNGESIVIPLSGWHGLGINSYTGLETINNKGEMVVLWTNETVPSFNYKRNYLEFSNITETIITQTNVVYWGNMKIYNGSSVVTSDDFGKQTDYAPASYASAWTFDTREQPIAIRGAYKEKYKHGYCVRPIKSNLSRETETPAIHVKSVEVISSGVSRVTVAFDKAQESGYTYRYYIGYSKSASKDSYATMNMSYVASSRTQNEVSYDVGIPTDGYEYSVYCYVYRIKSGVKEHFWSDNRIRFRSQMDPTKVLTGITVTPSTLVLDPGQQVQLTYAPTPSTATVNDVYYISYNPSVATVDYSTGLVTAVSKGAAQIVCCATGMNGQKYAYCTVTVPDRLNYGENGSSGSDISDGNVNDGGNW